MTKIIAEIGLNHMGNPKILNRMIKDLVKNKVDGISVQILDDSYYNETRPFRKKIEIKYYAKIAKILKKNKIKFGIALVNQKTIKDFKSINIDFWKILSMQFFNEKLIKEALKTNKDVYLSSGIVSNSDIRAMSKKYKKINFIHTSFSSNLKKTNILAISKLKDEIKNRISFGLHSELDDVIIGSIVLKADSVFFYVKYDDNIKYPDHEHAINLETLKYKIKTWKEIMISLGTGLKKREKLPSWVFE